MLYKGIEKYMHNYFWRVFHSNGWSHQFPKDFEKEHAEAEFMPPEA